MSAHLARKIHRLNCKQGIARIHLASERCELLSALCSIVHKPPIFNNARHPFQPIANDGSRAIILPEPMAGFGPRLLSHYPEGHRVPPLALRRCQLYLTALQQWPKVAKAADAVELENALNQAGALYRPEDRSDEVTGLGYDLCAGHRVIGCASDIIDAPAQMRPVYQPHVHDRRAQRHESLQFLVRNESNFCTRSKSPGVRQARIVVDRRERHRLVEKCDGHNVLQANVGNFAIVHYGRFVCRQPHRQLAYLSYVEGALCPQTLQRIERGLDWRAD